MAKAVFVLLGLQQLSAAIRIADDAGHQHISSTYDTNTNGNFSQECADGMGALFRTVSYRDLHNPVFDGTYRLRNRYSGKYMTGTAAGYLGTSLHHISTSKMSDWKLKRVQVPGARRFTLQNSNTGNYLAVRDGQLFKEQTPTEASHWTLTLAADGVHKVLGSVASTDRVILENRPSFVELAERPASELDGLKGEWYLEQQLSWIRWPQGDAAAYKAQWAQAGDIPIFEGSEYTWKQMCEDAKFDCATAYANQRIGFKMLGTTSETHRRVVTATTLAGSCDTDWSMIEYMLASNAKVLEKVRETVGQTCAERSLEDIGRHFKKGIVQECFKGCLDSITEYMVETNLPCAKPENITAIFLGVLDKERCDDVPLRSVEKMMEFAMFERCLTWHEPFPLWVADFKDRTSVAAADGNAVCSMPAGKESSRSSVDVLQAGVCPSGTTCQCPTGQVDRMLSAKELAAGQDFFIDEGSSLDEIVYDRASSVSQKVIQGVLLNGLTVGQALAGVPSTFFLAQVSWEFGSWVLQGLSFRCEQSVACWPDWPVQRTSTWSVDGVESSKKACRVPDHAKSGGSQVWFLPPPGVKVARKPWYSLRRCEFTACETSEMLYQKVGFGPSAEDRYNVYNCQRLPFEQMGAEEQREFLERVRETIPDEYASEI